VGEQVADPLHGDVAGEDEESERHKFERAALFDLIDLAAADLGRTARMGLALVTEPVIAGEAG
jgi:hypothetical protein